MEWDGLPTSEKCVHKHWKARVAGYEELNALFNKLDENSPEFTKYLMVLEKICTDSNALAQEKGLSTVLAFVENAHVAGRSCGEVMTALASKCLNSSRAKTKETSLEIILMYIEIDEQEQVQEELMKGLENKQPKVVVACIQAFRIALGMFGPNVISIKLLVKALPKLLEDRDKAVREESKMLAVEVFRWIGAVLRPQLAIVKPVQLSALDAEFGKLPPGKPTRTRFTRLALKAKAKAAAAVSVENRDGEEKDEDSPVVDFLDNIDPVEILSKLPKAFFEQIKAKKWQERKEMLEAVEVLATKNPKLLPGEYGDLVRALKKVLAKDNHVMLVALAAKCLAGLANGLKKKFSPYAGQCFEAVLIKFREKKPMVVTALRDCIDRMYPSTSLDSLTENLLTALADKNPNVKMETAAFIARCFTKATTTTLTKQILKPFIELLGKTINDSAPEVREAAFDALGTAMKVVGEEVMTALLGDVDLLKMTRIKECCERASKPPAAAAPKAVAKPAAAVKPPTRPGTAQLSALEAEFGKLPPGKPTQTRFTRLALKAKAKAAAAVSVENHDGEEKDEDSPVVVFDLLENIDPVEILSKLPKAFFEQIKAKKWQERKEMLEAVEVLATKSPKLLPGEYGDLVRALKKVLAKDNHVMLVALAAKCLAGLANGLKKKFSPYAGQCFDAVLIKFREKKPMVVTALRDCIDRMYPSTSLDSLTENLLTALADKNPNVKMETAAFIARCFTKATTTTLTKQILKPFIELLGKTINDSASEVREAAFDALGTAMKVVGEEVMTALLGDVDLLKMTRIKECCERASKPPAAAAPKVVAKPAAAVKPPTRPGTAQKAGVTKPGGALKKGASATGKKPAMAPGRDVKPAEPLTSDEVAEEKVNTLFSEETVNNLANSNWRVRMAAMESIEQEIKRTPKEDMPTQAVVRTIGAKKPGLKDNNVQVLRLRLASLLYLAENFNFSWTSVECILPDLVDRIGDEKNGQGCKDVLTAAAEATEFSKVAGEVVKMALEGKNVKNQTESLNWLSQAIYDFGFKVNIKPLVANLKKALVAANPAVRQSSITLLGVCYMYMGAPLRVLFENEKSALVAQIDSEFEKVKGQKPPTPVRGLKGAGDAGADVDEEEGGDDAAPAVDLIPRNDISEKITDELLAKLANKNWKIRKEGLDEVNAILSEAKFVTANLGGLPEALKLRLADSNKILVTTTLEILRSIAISSGPHCKRHVSIIAGPLLATMGDAKPMVRQAAINVLDSWVEQTKLGPFVKSGVFAESLRLENPYIRSTLLNWMAKQLKGQHKKLHVEIKECLLPLLTCLNDRNADVRKASQGAILPFMVQTGFDSMLKAASKIDKSSTDGVVAILEKTKAELPSKPQKVKSAPVVQSHISTKEIDDIMNDGDEGDEPPAAAKTSAMTVKGGKSAAAAKKPVTVRGKDAASSSSKKNNVEVDSSPIMTNTYTKAQRLKDEETLKVLKWNFTTPRLEFFEQLRDQMEKNFSASIMELLVHKDFQQHIKAIQMLSTALEMCRAETLANVDLVLKWFTLRFFETNPSMLKIALEYLIALFDVMAEERQQLTNIEADSFMPYLVLMVGESKENGRRVFRRMFESIYCVYPVSKMVKFIVGGLDSKNAKQRAECLEELGVMMETFTVYSILQPTPKVALKEIAKHIADRDNSVRNAALNTVAVAYEELGDQVYNYVGKLSDKDLRMLEEQIKRAARSEPAVMSELNGAPAAGKSGKARPSTAPSQTSPSKSNEALSQARPSTSSNPGNHAMVPPTLPPQFVTTTIWKQDPCPLATDLPKTHSETRNLRSTRPKRANELSPGAKGAVDLTITNVASGDLATAAASLSQLNYTASESRHRSMIKSSTDQIVTMVTLQLKQIHTTHLSDNDSDNETVFKVLTMCTSLLREMRLGDISTEVFKDYLVQAVSSILDPRLNDYPGGSEIISHLNLSLGRLLMSRSQSNTLCAALSLLHDCAGTVFQCTDSFTELVQKCIWKKTHDIAANIAKMDIRPILEICNSFFNDYPLIYWGSEANAKPLRTVKTVVVTLIQNAPERVYTVISLAPFGPKQELEAYIQRQITKLQQSNPNRMEEFIHNSLATIFNNIRENISEGIKELYQFRENYPEANLEPFLKQFSSTFQMYIERSLKNIEKEKETAATANRKSNESYTVHGSVNWDEEIRQHRQRMKKIGIRNTSSSTGNLAQSVSNPPDMVLSIHTSDVMENILPGNSSSDQAFAETPSSQSKPMDLKSILERINRRVQYLASVRSAKETCTTDSNTKL